jgi:hypothetical protein
MTRLEEIDERRRRKTRMRLPQLNKANRIAKRHAETIRYIKPAAPIAEPALA